MQISLINYVLGTHATYKTCKDGIKEHLQMHLKIPLSKSSGYMGYLKNVKTHLKQRFSGVCSMLKGQF